MAVHSGVFRLLSSNSLIMLSLMKLHGKPGITAIGCYGNRHGLLPFVLVRSHRYHVTLPPLPFFFFFFSVSTSPQNGTTCMCCVRMKYFILESGHHTNSSMPVLRNWLPNLSSIIFFFFCYLCTTCETLFNKVPIVIGLCLSKTQTLMFMTEFTVVTFSNQVFY